MDSAINTAARALAAGDPLAALDCVALREDAPALALRGISMAQLGELSRARELLRRAAHSFGPAQPVPRARCVAAEYEVALALRDLGASQLPLDEAIAVLDAAGDQINAAQGKLVRVRRSLVLGRCDDAYAERQAIDLSDAPARQVALAELCAAEIATRGLRADAAWAALRVAKAAARRAQIASLCAEVDSAARRLAGPAARCRALGRVHELKLGEVQELIESSTLIVDACRRVVSFRGDARPLTRRPVLFSLATALADAWPQGIARQHLMATVFGAHATNRSSRGRLRVEVGRLRALLAGLATLEATREGFRLVATDASRVVVLLPPVDGDNAAVYALLADGAQWSAPALALALGVSTRTVQRALVCLRDSGAARPLGRARAQRWVAAPTVAFTTALLLPLADPGG